MKKQIKGTESGFTLVELLVAISIGLFLTAALIQSYLATRQTYLLTQGIGRIQEDTRLASHFLSDHIRRAGNLGCISHLRTRLSDEDYINFTSPIIGWDYAGTDSAVNSYTLASNEVRATNRTPWRSSLGDRGINVTRNTIRGFFTSNRTQLAAFTDILIINSVKETSFMLDREYSPSATEFITTEDNNFPGRQALIMGDCVVADAFIHESSDDNKIELRFNGGGRPHNDEDFDALPFSYSWGPTSKIYEVDTAMYYVGIGASGSPSLYRFPLGTGNFGGNSDPVELVENVETLQVLYGEDIDDDDLPDRFVSATFVASWPNIVAVKLGMIIRSSTPIKNDQSVDQLRLLDHMTVTPQDPADGYLRYAVNLTIKPRNTGSARTYTVTSLDDSIEHQLREPLVP